MTACGCERMLEAETECPGISQMSNGAEALRLIHDAVPAVLLTDLAMPMMNGQSLVEACRAEPRMDAMPIVVMSAESPAVLDTVSTLGVQPS